MRPIGSIVFVTHRDTAIHVIT
ncbi:hypothetical protein MED222_05470 [Vibrio sp. MED222]|nr:hypothetical protein MED222_05470 [Vibrio sp. MED222]